VAVLANCTVPGLDQRTSESEAATGMAKFFARPVRSGGGAALHRVLNGAAAAGGAATRPSMLGTLVARGSRRTVRRRWMEAAALEWLALPVRKICRPVLL
jgi:hypothetical protein